MTRKDIAFVFEREKFVLLALAVNSAFRLSRASGGDLASGSGKT